MKTQITPRGLEFANLLEQLSQLPLVNATDLEKWTEASNELDEWIEAHEAELPCTVPQQLFQYFTDVDIRTKGSPSRAHQEGEVKLFIKQLRGESLPERKGAWWKFW